MGEHKAKTAQGLAERVTFIFDFAPTKLFEGGIHKILSTRPEGGIQIHVAEGLSQ